MFPEYISFGAGSEKFVSYTLRSFTDEHFVTTPIKVVFLLVT